MYDMDYVFNGDYDVPVYRVRKVRATERSDSAMQKQQNSSASHGKWLITDVLPRVLKSAATRPARCTTLAA